MTIQVRITFRDDRRSWSVPGLAVPFTSLTVGDMTNRVQETEAYLSKITGLRVKIETAAGEPCKHAWAVEAGYGPRGHGASWCTKCRIAGGQAEKE